MPIPLWHNVFMASMAQSAPLPSPIESLHIDLQTIETGVPLDTLVNFVADSGLHYKDVYSIVIPARTLKHRRSRQEPLSLDESDKFARLVRMFDQAVRVFGNREKALRWLGKPKERFAGRTPLEMIRTDLGGRMLEELLGQIDEGYFA
jgi:putative toxin-antitoxin system antitoxin component (TIGR02293 family)